VNTLVNTTVLSNFASTQCLDLLRLTVGPLYLPVQVYNEIVVGQMAGYAFYDGIELHIAPFAADGWLRLLTMTDDELPIFASLPLHLHPAERTCLSIARRRGWGFLSDDRRLLRKRNIEKRPRVTPPPHPERPNLPANMPLAPMLRALPHQYVDMFEEHPERLMYISETRPDMD